MSPPTAVRPETDEYAPYYATYIDRVTDEDPLQALESGLEEMTTFLRRLTESQGNIRYAPEKWSVKQVLGHVADAERVFAYRALRFGRGDTTAVPGFEENLYAERAGSDRRPLADLVAELEDIRRASLALFRGFGEEAWAKRGVANQNEISVRALAFVIAGHARHHLAILRDRYLTT